MNNLKDETIIDLKEKIKKIDSFLVDEKSIIKANSIKQKAIDILNNAIDTLNLSNVDDDDEFINGLNLVKEKSDKLYDDVIIKLKTFDNFENDDIDDFSRSCIKVLNEWLSESEKA